MAALASFGAGRQNHPPSPLNLVHGAGDPYPQISVKRHGAGRQAHLPPNWHLTPLDFTREPSNIFTPCFNQKINNIMANVIQKAWNTYLFPKGCEKEKKSSLSDHCLLKGRQPPPPLLSMWPTHHEEVNTNYSALG
jgi:hypothetical protein